MAFSINKFKCLISFQYTQGYKKANKTTKEYGRRRTKEERKKKKTTTTTQGKRKEKNTIKEKQKKKEKKKYSNLGYKRRCIFFRSKDFSLMGLLQPRY